MEPEFCCRYKTYGFRIKSEETPWNGLCFTDSTGLANGPQSGSYLNPLRTKKWDDLLIVSPFVKDNTINNFSDKTKRYIWLLSRKEELDSLKKTTLEKVESFNFSRFILTFLSRLGKRVLISRQKKFIRCFLFPGLF